VGGYAGSGINKYNPEKKISSSATYEDSSGSSNNIIIIYEDRTDHSGLEQIMGD
jgi:hypothetical protein